MIIPHIRTWDISEYLGRLTKSSRNLWKQTYNRQHRPIDTDDSILNNSSHTNSFTLGTFQQNFTYPSLQVVRRIKHLMGIAAMMKSLQPFSTLFIRDTERGMIKTTDEIRKTDLQPIPSTSYALFHRQPIKNFLIIWKHDRRTIHMPWLQNMHHRPITTWRPQTDSKQDCDYGTPLMQN